jgi:hypothetical protein
VRHTSLAAIALVLLAGVARAEDGEDRIVGFRPFAIGAGFGGVTGDARGHTTGGFGPTAELALGDGRVQYFVDGMVVRATPSSRDTTTPPELRPDGWWWLGDLGARWLARAWQPDANSAIEMHLEAMAGLDAFRWRSGGGLVRPNIGFGWAWQARYFPRHLAFHITARVLFAPSDAGPMVACRGTCAPMTGPQAGFGALFGVSW